MLRPVWKPITAAVVIALPAYFYYSTYKHQTFKLSVKEKDANGKIQMSKKTFPLLSMKTLADRIRDNATFHSYLRPDGLVWNHSTAALASNDPIEDANSNQMIRRDDSDPSGAGDLLFFTVMDGHGGHHTSRLLSRILINAVALELSSLIEVPPKQSLLQQIKSVLWSPQTSRSGLDSDPQLVSLAIQDAFTKLDSELMNAPLQVLANSLDGESRKNKIVPDLSQHPMALTTMLPALSGSCALMAVLDILHRNLYIACTGDSRAVAGVWEQTAGDRGAWRVQVLSEDQTARNPDELKRIQSEHPENEAQDVVRNGRILGGLEPSRAFGDARYKWPVAIQEVLSQAFLVGNDKPIRPPPPPFKTPPYVIARPVVTHHKLSFPPLGDSSDNTLRFLVLATDGLWDQLSSEEVVSLVGGHLAGLRGTIPKTSLPSLVPVSSSSPTIEGKDQKRKKEEGSWAFMDDNISAHLIRNAFGGGDEMALRKLLSIPAPYSRRYRDDVTVTVVWWEDGREDGAKISSFSTEKLKSKL